jgi:hypothetical protein
MYIKFYPEFFKNNGGINTKNLLKRKEIMQKYYKKFLKNKLNLLIMDEQMANELKIKHKHHTLLTKPNRLFIYYKNKILLNLFIKYYKAGAKISKNSKINNLNNLILIYSQFIYLIMGIKKYKNILINIIINEQKISKNKEKELLNKSKDKEGCVSYIKFYNLKYKYLITNKKKFNNNLKENIKETQLAYEITMKSELQ